MSKEILPFEEGLSHLTGLINRIHDFRGGTSLQGYVSIAPARLVEIFGEPDESDGYKVSGEYRFELNGETFTLYDWKNTDLYEPGYGCPDAFWKSTNPYNFHVGGAGKSMNLQIFIEAVQEIA